MAGATSPDNIYVPQTTDDLTPLATPMANLANSVQTAISARFRGYAGPIQAIPVANAAARGAAFPTPIQGDSVFRLDKGWTERYYGTYNVTTNPGGAVAGAGWYPVEGVLPWYSSVQSATASIPNVTWTGVNADGTVTNRGGFSLSGTQINVPMPGYYSIQVNAMFAARTTGTARGIRFNIDGSVDGNTEWNDRQAPYPNANLPVAAYWQGYVASSVKPEFYHNTGSPLNVLNRRITVRYLGAG